MAEKPVSPPRHWSREPMVWMLIALPAIAVIGGVATFWLAARSGSLDASIDSVQRTAQIQQTDLAADRQALRRGLSASLQWDAEAVVVQVLGDIPHDQPLRLHLSHPTDSTQDHELALQPEGDHWRAVLPRPEALNWNLTLQDARGEWRLDGQLPRGQQHALLSPRFSDD